MNIPTQCEFCDDPITEEEVDNGEVGTETVRLGDGSIDDEFIFHLRCTEVH